MIENEMDYRGSKSEKSEIKKKPLLHLRNEKQMIQPKEISVKEQRVDGSYFG
jgi:hypothetical protein